MDPGPEYIEASARSESDHILSWGFKMQTGGVFNVGDGMIEFTWSGRAGGDPSTWEFFVQNKTDYNIKLYIQLICAKPAP